MLLLEVYYKPKKNVLRERRFAESLIDKLYPDAVHNENYPIPTEKLLEGVKTVEMVKWVDTLVMPPKKWSTLTEELSRCPNEVRVALNANRISCDIVVVNDGLPHYFEFHEAQHRKLTATRPSKIYGIEGETYVVPRFVQRLYRDVWRAKHLKPYTIVWADWFEQNGVTSIDVMQAGRAEYRLPDTPSFISA